MSPKGDKLLQEEHGGAMSSTRFTQRMRRYALKLRRRRNQARYERIAKNLFKRDVDYVRLRLKLKWLSGDRWNLGTGPGVNPFPTFEEFLRLEVEQAPHLDEDTQIIHELACGGKLKFLPKWIYVGVNVPPSWYCIQCNRLFLRENDGEPESSTASSGGGP